VYPALCVGIELDRIRHRADDGEPGTAASWIQAGDVIVAVNGYLITTMSGAIRLARLNQQSARLTLRRDRRRIDVIVPDNVPIQFEEIAGRPVLRSYHDSSVIATLWTRDSQIVRQYRNGAGTSGEPRDASHRTESFTNQPPSANFKTAPVIAAVSPGGPAQAAGIQPGDTLHAVDGLATTSSAGSVRFASVRPRQTVRFTIVRRGRTMELQLTAGTGP
jgi:S1-C subfamily serine protease